MLRQLGSFFVLLVSACVHVERARLWRRKISHGRCRLVTQSRFLPLHVLSGFLGHRLRSSVAPAASPLPATSADRPRVGRPGPSRTSCGRIARSCRERPQGVQDARAPSRWGVERSGADLTAERGARASPNQDRSAPGAGKSASATVWPSRREALSYPTSISAYQVALSLRRLVSSGHPGADSNQQRHCHRPPSASRDRRHQGTRKGNAAGFGVIMWSMFMAWPLNSRWIEQRRVRSRAFP